MRETHCRGDRCRVSRGAGRSAAQAPRKAASDKRLTVRTQSAEGGNASSGTETGGAGERKGRRNGVGVHTEGAGLDTGLKARGQEGQEGPREHESASQGDACRHTRAPAQPGGETVSGFQPAAV